MAEHCCCVAANILILQRGCNEKVSVTTIVQYDSSLISTLWFLFPKPDSSYITASPGSSQEGVKHLTPFTFDSENRDFLLSLSAFDVKRRAKVNCLNPSNFSLNHFRGIKNFLTHTEKQPGTQGGLFEATSTSTTCWEETGDEETYRVSVRMSLNHPDLSKMRRARSYMPLFFLPRGERSQGDWYLTKCDIFASEHHLKVKSIESDVWYS